MSERNVEKAWWGGDSTLYDYDALRPEREPDRNGPVHTRKEILAMNDLEKTTINHLADMALSLSKAMRGLAGADAAEIVAKVGKIVAEPATATKSPAAPKSPEALAKKNGKRFVCPEAGCAKSVAGNGFRSKGEATHAGLANHLHVAHAYTAKKANAAVA